MARGPRSIVESHCGIEQSLLFEYDGSRGAAENDFEFERTFSITKEVMQHFSIASNSSLAELLTMVRKSSFHRYFGATDVLHTSLRTVDTVATGVKKVNHRSGCETSLSCT